MGTTKEARDVNASRTSGKLFFFFFNISLRELVNTHHSTTLRRERAYSPLTALTPTQTRDEGQGMEGGGDEKVAKRRVWRRLGPNEYYYYFLRVFFDTNQCFIVNIGCNL